jgi:hypothetical protein
MNTRLDNHFSKIAQVNSIFSRSGPLEGCQRLHRGGGQLKALFEKPCHFDPAQGAL